jgi:uncharacterized protein
MLRIVKYASRLPGAKLVVFGAIHGHEKCGPFAIHRAMRAIDDGELHLVRGEVTFVPICNPRAYSRNVRFTERDLNRFFVPTDNPDTYEGELTNVLSKLVEGCDALLDIHSYTAAGPPFLFASLAFPQSCEFAVNLGDMTLITGWHEAVCASGKSGAGLDDAFDTCRYAESFGAVAATLECGQHQDPAAPDVAYRGIRNALRYLGMTDEARDAKKLSEAGRVLLTRIYDREGGETMAKEWRHLDRVGGGEVIGYRNGIPVAAPENGFLILPNTPPPQWFYFGIEKNR